MAFRSLCPSSQVACHLVCAMWKTVHKKEFHAGSIIYITIKERFTMQLLLKDRPVLNVEENGICEILDFDRLPFALRKEKVTFIDFIEWASNRTLSIGRSYAKEILNTLRLPQSNRFAVCRACRGLSLEDAYWIRQEDDNKTWEEVSLFRNPLTLFVTEVSLSGRNVHYSAAAEESHKIHTPELTTLGASAKGWIRKEGRLFLHKVGKYEIPADQILEALGIPHIHYRVSELEEISSYLTEERKEWIGSVGEAVVNSELFTSEDISLVTFEEFRTFCSSYGLDPYEEAEKMDPVSYLKMQIADYILNNNDRHDQNWGFLMENATGKLTGFCPLFDHDHAFVNYENIMSQTTKEVQTLYEAACMAQNELKLDLRALDRLPVPKYLSEMQWKAVQERKEKLLGGPGR